MPTLASPPVKSTVGFTLQWGSLVQVPVRLFTAVEDTTPIKRSQYTATGNKVIQPKTDSVTMKPATDIKLMVPVGDKLVELSDEEMAQVTSDFNVDRGSVPIQFVPLEKIGTRYRVEKWYQARSGLKKVGEKSIPDPHADKVFALLLQSMAKRNVACLFRTALKGAARYAALTPDGNVHFLFYDGEVREDFGWPDTTISKAEAEQGLDLIDAVGVSEPDLDDERGAALRAFVEKKAKDPKVKAIAVPSGEGLAEVVDLTAALAASVKQAKAKKAPAKKAVARKKAS